MKKILFFIFLLVSPFLVNAVEINTSLKGLDANFDEHYEGISVADNEGYVLVGSYNSDVLIKKLNFDKELIWSKSYNGTGEDYLYDVEMTNDGYIIVGYTSSTDIPGLVNKGNKDAYILKLDFKGELLWMKSFGGSEDDIFYDVEVLNDGSYVAVGSSLSKDLENMSFGSAEDALIVRYDMNGNVLFSNVLPGDALDVFRGASSTKDGGYIVVGTTMSKNLGFTANSMGDGIIYKYNSSNQLMWIQQVGVPSEAILGDGIYGAVWQTDATIGVYDVIEVSDGYVLVGRMQEQQATYGKGIYGGNMPMLFASIMKYDFDGTYIWGKCINDSGGTFYDVVEGSDNTYWVVGNIEYDADPVTINYSSDGEILKQYNISGSSYNAQNTSVEMIYNNYIVVTGKYSGSSITYFDGLSGSSLNKGTTFNGKYDSYIFDIDYVYNIDNVTEDPNGNVEVERVNGFGLARVNANTGFKVYTVKVLDADNNELTVVDNGDGTYSFPLSKDVRVEVTFMEDVDNPKTFDSSFLIILISLFFGGVVALLFYLILKHDKVSIEL